MTPDGGTLRYTGTDPVTLATSGTNRPLDLTAADAIINCWNDKYYWNFWRPITAIREADIDDNPATVADPDWKPLFDPSLDSSIAGVGPALITGDTRDIVFYLIGIFAGGAIAGLVQPLIFPNVTTK